MRYPCEICKQISIHAPREGSDMRELGLDWNADKFLSTLPARGATTPTYFLFS